MAEQCTILWAHHILLTLSLTNGQFPHFWLTITNAHLNICGSVWVNIFQFSWHIWPGMGCLGHLVTLCWTSWGLEGSFLKGMQHFHLHQQHELYLLCSLPMCMCVDCNYPREHVTSPWLLKHIVSYMTNDVRHFLMINDQEYFKRNSNLLLIQIWATYSSITESWVLCMLQIVDFIRFINILSYPIGYVCSLSYYWNHHLLLLFIFFETHSFHID